MIIGTPVINFYRCILIARRRVLPQVSFDVLSCTASILNLCMISVDRYYAITKPLEYGVKRTPRRMLVCVSLVWLGAACISLPPVLILGNEHSTVDGVPHCTVCQNFGYQIYATLGSFYIPLTVMITVYYKIFRAARKIVLEERRAQSHLENSHCYLEISVKNGVGPVESKIATAAPERGQPGHRASSSASTVTTVSVVPPHSTCRPTCLSTYLPTNRLTDLPTTGRCTPRFARRKKNLIRI